MKPETLENYDMYLCCTTLLALTFFLTIGCTSFQPMVRPKPPAVLQGSNADIREHLLREIPIGTSREDAESRVKSLGLNLVPPSEFEPEASRFIHCRFDVRKGRSGQNTWMIQIDCPEGKVTDAFCEQIGVE
jgi:hypothetical protein